MYTNTDSLSICGEYYFCFIFLFTYLAISSRDIESSPDTDSSSTIDITTSANDQASTNAPRTTYITGNAGSPTSMDASSGTDVSTTDDVPASTSETVKPTTVMLTTTGPRSAAVVRTTFPTPIAQDCSDILDQGYTGNYGIYRIQPSGDSEHFDVVCDLETNGTEWIVFQRRFDGSVDFYLPWEDYKNGFGNLTGEHWLGLEKLYRLTKNGVWQLRVDLEDFSGNTAYAEYSNFAIGDESTSYTLSVGEYSGTAGDSLTVHANMAFSTYDQDHDKRSVSIGCAVRYKGGWWYKNCVHCNLNGLYFGSRVSDDTGMTWRTWIAFEVLKKSEMKIRRIG